MAIYSNLSVDQGSDFTTAITVEDATGNPANLTGYVGAGQVRKTYTSSTVAADFIVAITYPAQGVVNITLTNAQTNAMKAGRYVYDIEVRDSNMNVTRIVEGQLEVLPGVTQTL
jgi:hypothetical protein